MWPTFDFRVINKRQVCLEWGNRWVVIWFYYHIEHCDSCISVDHHHGSQVVWWGPSLVFIRLFSRFSRGSQANNSPSCHWMPLFDLCVHEAVSLQRTLTSIRFLTTTYTFIAAAAPPSILPANLSTKSTIHITYAPPPHFHRVMAAWTRAPAGKPKVWCTMPGRFYESQAWRCCIHLVWGWYTTHHSFILIQLCSGAILKSRSSSFRWSLIT